MSEPPFETTFLNFLDQSIDRAKRSADRAMIQFVVLRVALVATSASLPAFTAIADNRGWSTGDAVAVAVLAGLDTQFRWGEEWRHFRSTQLALQRMKRDYEYRKSAVDVGRVAGTITTNDQNFEKLFADVEELLQSEADSFFKFRITEWRSQGRPA